jgi:mannan endo-1,4-beta-mannosidase
MNITRSQDPLTPAASTATFMNNATISNIPGRFLTIPLSGFAAADTNGTVFEYDSGRFLPVLNRKTSEYLLSPDLDDGFVYTDEYIAYMINRFGGRNDETDLVTGMLSTGITGYFLGREPESYKTQFPSLGFPPMTAESLSSEIVDAALMVKMIDPAADVFAPGIRNLESFINLSNASDWETHSDEHSWCIDYFLSAMKDAEAEYGERLLDVLDLQFFTEAVSGSGVSVLASSSDSANRARMEAPRLFWDSDYTEQSKSAVTYKAYTPLIPILQASIRMNYPGTKLAFSEYSFGGGDNVSGGITVAETLGIFGESGVYMAGLVPGEDSTYELAGLELFTNFDHAGSGFESVSVSSLTYSDAIVYASTGDENDSRLTIVALNKSDYVMPTRFSLHAETDYEHIRVYGFDETSAALRDMTAEFSADGGDGDDNGMSANDVGDSTEGADSTPALTVDNNAFDYDLRPMTAYIFELTGVWNGTSLSSDTSSDPQAPAVTDEYGATITESATLFETTIAPTSEDNPKTSLTTVSAPASDKPSKNNGEIPILLKVFGTALIVAVFFVMALVVFKTLKH